MKCFKNFISLVLVVTSISNLIWAASIIYMNKATNRIIEEVFIISIFIITISNRKKHLQNNEKIVWFVSIIFTIIYKSLII